MKVIIGGPAYDMKCTVRHAGSMAALGITLSTSGKLKDIAYNWKHGCPVEVPRNELFADALASGFDFLIWADADVSWPWWGGNELIWLCEELRRTQCPMCAVPVAQRNGDVNVILDSSLARPVGNFKVERKLRRCFATGMGLVVFWLDWYRANWAEGPWFRTDWIPYPMATDPVRFFSEDVWHGMQLNRPVRLGHRAGARWAPLFPTDHVSGPHGAPQAADELGAKLAAREAPAP